MKVMRQRYCPVQCSKIHAVCQAGPPAVSVPASLGSTSNMTTVFRLQSPCLQGSSLSQQPTSIMGLFIMFTQLCSAFGLRHAVVPDLYMSRHLSRVCASTCRLSTRLDRSVPDSLMTLQLWTRMRKMTTRMCATAAVFKINTKINIDHLQ